MRAPSFADLLDEALGRTPLTPPGPAAWQRSVPPGAAAFLFAKPLTAALPRWVVAPDARPRRPHRLTDEQRRAFDRLLDLGAAVAPDFSADELRRAYRRLAQRYHPDRHAASDEGAQAEMARRFAEATAGYRCLLTVVEPRH